MPTPVSECLYCQKLPVLNDLMIKIADLSVSQVFLFKEQSHHGRCNVVYHKHGVELHELSEQERNSFMSDVAKVAAAIDKCFEPTKINYGAYADKLSHLHMHIVPKYADGFGFGGVFEMNPQKVYLSDSDYKDLVDLLASKL